MDLKNIKNEYLGLTIPMFTEIMLLKIAIFLIAAIYFVKSNRWNNVFAPKINVAVVFWIVISIYFIFYSTLKLTQYYSMNINAIDFSLYDYALFNSARGLWFYVPFWGGSFLKEHFSLFLTVLVPLYKVWSSPLNLLILQSAAVAAAGVPLYAIAKNQMKNAWIALTVVFVFLNNWYVVHGLLYEFHVEMFLPLLILMMIWAYLKKLHIVYWISLVLALLVKEDVGLYLIPFGLFVALRDRRVLQGGLTVVISAAIVWIGLSVISWLNHPGGETQSAAAYKFMSNWSRYGTNIFSMIGYWFVHPLEFVKVFMNGRVNGLLWPLAYIPLLSWWALLLIIPIGLNASSQNMLQAGFQLYYAAPVIPFLFVALIFGLKNIRVRTGIKYAWITPVILAFMLVFGVHKYIPDHVEAWHWKVQTELEKIPQNASVAAQGNLIPHLGYRNDIHILRGKPIFADYIIVCPNAGTYPMEKREADSLIDSFEKNANYVQMVNSPELIIFKNKSLK